MFTQIRFPLQMLLVGWRGGVQRLDRVRPDDLLLYGQAS